MVSQILEVLAAVQWLKRQVHCAQLLCPVISSRIKLPGVVANQSGAATPVVNVNASTVQSHASSMDCRSFVGVGQLHMIQLCIMSAAELFHKGMQLWPLGTQQLYMICEVTRWSACLVVGKKVALTSMLHQRGSRATAVQHASA